MEFCPSCGNLLQYELLRLDRPGGFFCQTCPYVASIERKVKIKRPVRLPKKDEKPITIEGESEKNAGATTDATCPKCLHGKAIFQQQQTRSGDEPMTIIYKCLGTDCENVWRDE